MQPFEKQIFNELIRITCDDCNEMPSVKIKGPTAEINAKCPNLRNKIFERHFELYAMHEAQLKGRSLVIVYR